LGHFDRVFIDLVNQTMLIGDAARQLSLSGSIRPVRGALPIAAGANILSFALPEAGTEFWAIFPD
jgi:predicted ATPase with chaperone activity